MSDILDEQHKRALATLPPGRTLAGEYFRLRSYIEELNRQVVRGTELRIAAEQRAGRPNVGQLEDRVEELERSLRRLWRRRSGQALASLEAENVTLRSRLAAYESGDDMDRIEAYEEALAIALAATDNHDVFAEAAHDATPAARELLGLE